MSLQGTRLIYYNTDSDVLLLAIPGAIPDHYQAYHLGFDAAVDAVPTSAVVIHHPDGSPKSISYVNSRCPATHLSVTRDVALTSLHQNPDDFCLSRYCNHSINMATTPKGQPYKEMDMRLPMTFCVGHPQIVTVSHQLSLYVQRHLHKLHQAGVSSRRDSAHRCHTLAGISPARAALLEEGALCCNCQCSTGP